MYDYCEMRKKCHFQNSAKQLVVCLELSLTQRKVRKSGVNVQLYRCSKSLFADIPTCQITV
jgi:hypothetical protein